jgi:hypothetical protein
VLLLLAVVPGRSLAPAADGASSGWRTTFAAELPATQHNRSSTAEQQVGITLLRLLSLDV